MSFDETNSDRLDGVLRRSYSLLASPVAEQRAAVLTGFVHVRAHVAANPVRRPVWRGRVAWLAAASIVLAVGIKILFIPSQGARVYGLESAGRRLCEVKTIRVRGAMYVRNDAKPSDPPIRVPIEYLVKRPAQFSHTWNGVSQDGKTLEIRLGKRVCDGHHEMNTSDTEKSALITPINPIDAQLGTEVFAQWILRFAVLGRPEAPYKKTGRETIRGLECDVYEARSEAEEDGSVTVDKLWFDPASGHPVRKTFDRLLADGTTERDSEYDEIEVDVSLDDKLFATEPFAGFKRLGEAPAEKDRVAPMSLDSTSSGAGGNQTIAAWHCLRITDRVALVTWRRSVPQPKADGTLDWLSQMEFGLNAPKAAARHAWLYQSGSPEVWNWSLVAAVDHSLPDPGIVEFKLRTERFNGTLNVGALRFSDEQLEQILKAAAATALPEGVPRYSLAELRTKACELSGEPGNE